MSKRTRAGLIAAVALIVGYCVWAVLPPSLPKEKDPLAHCPPDPWTTPTEDVQPGLDRVVLVTIDTLRADHLKMYGYPISTAPFIESLASKGVVFETTITSSSHTGPSHASLFTARSPWSHGMLRNGSILDDDVNTLACMMARRGFETAGFSSVSFLDGLQPGFGTFMGKHDLNKRLDPAEAVVDAAIQWLEAKQRDRFFVWIHLYDVHQWMYDEDIAAADRAVIEKQRGTAEEHYRFLRDLHHLSEPGNDRRFLWNMDLESWDIEELDLDGRARVVHYIDNYDAQIVRVDRALRQLSEVVAGTTLQSAGKETLWIVTADHGEGLGSHDYHSHGKHLYDEQLKVPLILYTTGSGGNSRFEVPRVTHQVRLIDVLPTLGELVGIGFDGDESVEGQSLIPLLNGDQGDDGSPRLAFSERRPADKRFENYLSGGVYVLRSEDAKLIYRTEHADAFYNLADDPGELRDLMATSPPREAVAFGMSIEQRLVEARRVNAPREPTELPEHVEAELRALGYIE